MLSDAAGNTNANTSNRLSFKLTSKRRTVHMFTNATDATSSSISVWIRTEVPVWPNLSESDIHVQHAEISNFRQVNSTTYSFRLLLLLRPSSSQQYVVFEREARDSYFQSLPNSIVKRENTRNISLVHSKRVKFSNTDIRILRHRLTRRARTQVRSQPWI